MDIMNQVKTVLLLGLLTALALGVGYLFGGISGLTIAFAFALLMNGIMYFFSDKIVLFMYHAKEAPKEQYPELHSVVEEVAAKAGIPTPKVYVMESATPNAFATGRNPRNGVVCCTTSILQLLNRKELSGVLAHEMAHIKNRDILVTTIAATIAAVVSYVGMMARFVPFIAMLIQLAISRSREYLADASGAHFLHDGDSLASALAKLEHGIAANPMTSGPQAASSLFIANPFSLKGIAGLLSTHPPMEQRISRLKKMNF